MMTDHVSLEIGILRRIPVLQVLLDEWNNSKDNLAQLALGVRSNY